MRTHTLTLRSATTAIAAVLVLGSTPLLAQAVSPTGDPVILAPAPTTTAPPVTQAAPVASPAAAPVTTSAPVVQSLPSTYVPATAAAPDAVPSATPSSASSAPKRAVAATPAKRAVVAAPVAAAAPTAATAPIQAPAAGPVDQPASPELFPASETAQAETGDVVTTPKPAADAVDDFTVLTGVLGGLVLIGIGWFGVVLARRRKIHKRSEAVAVTRPVVTPRNEPLVVTRAAVASPVAPQVSVSDPAPVMADPQAIPAVNQPRPIRADMAIPAVARAENAFGAGHARWADEHRPRQVQAPVKGALPSNGASVDLPAQRPENPEEREALFRRMVEAKPDKANPFKDRRARMKRARLILASLGRNFGDAAPMIDLSQYPNNWPELAHRGYPQAA